MNYLKISKIIKEEIDDFQWMRDIEPELDIEMGQLWLRYDGVNANTEKFFLKEAEALFDDISVENDRVYLMVDGYVDFSSLFDKADNSQYGYVNEWLFKRVHDGDNDYWEPYTDVVYDWEEQVWSLIESNKEMFDIIIKLIKQKIKTSEITVELDSSSPWGTEPVLLDEEVLSYLANKNTAQLGFIIDSDSNYIDLFEDIKRETSMAYADAYNITARDNIYKASIEPIIEMFGEGSWKEKKVGERTRYEMVFDVTSDFTYNLDQYFSNCFDDCSRYFNPSDHDDEQTEEEHFENFCDDCWEIPYSDYLSFLKYELFERGVYEEFNPRFDEYPDYDEIVNYFNETFFNYL
jgi:hypothetical protein